MKTQSSFAVQSIGLFGGISRPKLFPFSIDLDRGPKTTIGAFTYAPKSSAVIGSLSLIAIIISARSFPQIFSSIVEGIVILMVTFDAIPFFESKNLSMHRNASLFSVYNSGPISIEALSARIPMRVPLPLLQPFEIGSINNRLLPSGQGNNAIIFNWGGHVWLLQSLKCAGVSAPTIPLYQEVAWQM